MRVALVASRYLPHRGALEQRVHELARELARRGADVEVLTQDPVRRSARVSERGGVVIRRFPTPLGHRSTVAPGLWEHLHRTAASFDVADVHGAHPLLGLVPVWAGVRRLVFTPHAPMQRLLSWSNAVVTRPVVEHAACTVCTSRAEASLLRQTLPSAAESIHVVPSGVDVAAIQAAEPFSGEDGVVLAVGRLERRKRLDRVIAGMVATGSELRLVVVGEGPARRRLEAYASDLAMSSRVDFVGAVPDRELHRWLRTARVVVDLAEEAGSGLQVLEACAADTPAVLSDIPTHREAASYVGTDGVVFVPPKGSPLDVAEAILDATAIRLAPQALPRVPTWDMAVESTLALYDEVVLGSPRPVDIAGRRRLRLTAET
jgi:glycosyltransferase involved in cell wall biosynthesis